MWRWDQAEPFADSPADENPSGLGTFNLPLRLPGQRYDAETGLHYNYFRDYEPALGRYGQSDPIGIRAGLNTYSYTKSNPLRWIDPYGLRCKNVVDIVVGPAFDGAHNWLFFCVWACATESCPPKVFFRSAVIVVPLHQGCPDTPP